MPNNEFNKQMRQLDLNLNNMPKPNMTDTDKKHVHQSLMQFEATFQTDNKRRFRMSQVAYFVGGIGAVLILLFIVLPGMGLHVGEHTNQAQDPSSTTNHALYPERIGDTSIDELKAYAGTYVGNNADVFAIIQRLPGSHTYQGQGLRLRDQMISVTYMHPHTQAAADHEAFWFESDDQLETIMLHNVIFLATLVPNAEGFEFIIQDVTFSISREDVDDFLVQHWDDYPQGDALWDNDTVAAFLDRQEQTIYKQLDSEQFRNAFFEAHPIE